MDDAAALIPLQIIVLCPHSPYRLQCVAGAVVGVADAETNLVHIRKRMGQHGALHLRVDTLPPAEPGQIGPADFNRAASLGVEFVITCRTQNLLIAPATRHQRAAAGHSFIEERVEHLALPAVVDRMLFPHHRVGSDLEQSLAVRLFHRAQHQPLCLEGGLQVHARLACCHVR